MTFVILKLKWKRSESQKSEYNNEQIDRKTDKQQTDGNSENQKCHLSQTIYKQN